MELVRNLLGIYPRGHRQDLFSAFQTKGDVERSLNARLWNVSQEEFLKLLQRERLKIHNAYCHHLPESQARISLEQFVSHARGDFSSNSGLNDHCFGHLYRILLTFGSFPFPLHPETVLDAEVFLLAMGMARRNGEGAMSMPGYYLPKCDTSHAGAKSCRRTRGDREQLRLLFQTLATEIPSPDRIRSPTEKTPDINEDLLDALAFSMELDDEFKLRYYPQDFAKATARLPSSESTRKLDYLLSWADLTDLLRLLLVAAENPAMSTPTRSPDKLEDELERLICCFRNHDQSDVQGISWSGFYQEMEAQGLARSPAPKTLSTSYGGYYQRHVLRKFNYYMVQICEGLQKEYSTSWGESC